MMVLLMIAESGMKGFSSSDDDRPLFKVFRYMFLFCIRKCNPDEHLLWVLTQFDKYLAIFCNRW